MAVTLQMTASSLLSVCEIAGQELGEDLVVVPQVYLESS